MASFAVIFISKGLYYLVIEEIIVTIFVTKISSLFARYFFKKQFYY